MKRILAVTGMTSRVLVWIGGTLIILSALTVTFDVVTRKLFDYSIGGADELSGYAFAIATTFGLAFALFERAHIRVDALHNLFPAPVKILADFVGIILLAGFAGVVCAMAWDLVADTLQYNSKSITPMRTPLAIPQIPWLGGWLFFCFSAVLVIVAALWALINRDMATVNQLIGAKTIDEQIEDETV